MAASPHLGGDDYRRHSDESMTDDRKYELRAKPGAREN